MYADDTSITVAGPFSNNKVLKEKLDALLTAIINFLADNGLLVNGSKTELIRLSTYQQLTANHSPDIKLDMPGFWA